MGEEGLSVQRVVVGGHSPIVVKGHRSRNTCRCRRPLSFLFVRASISSVENPSLSVDCNTLLLVSGSTSHIALDAMLTAVRSLGSGGGVQWQLCLCAQLVSGGTVSTAF